MFFANYFVPSNLNAQLAILRGSQHPIFKIKKRYWGTGMGEQIRLIRVILVIYLVLLNFKFNMSVCLCYLLLLLFK